MTKPKHKSRGPDRREWTAAADALLDGWRHCPDLQCDRAIEQLVDLSMMLEDPPEFDRVVPLLIWLAAATGEYPEKVMDDCVHLLEKAFQTEDGDSEPLH